MDSNDINEKNHNTAHILCYISLGLMYVVPVSIGVIGKIAVFVMPEPFNAIIGSMVPLSIIVAYVLMICARVYSPTCKLAKIIMWVYIVQAIVAIIMITIAIALFMIICNECLESCRGLGLWNIL